MQVDFRAPKGRPYRKTEGRTLLVTGVLLIQVVMAAVFYFTYRVNPVTAVTSRILQATGRHPSVAALSVQRTALLRQIGDWNEQAAAVTAAGGGASGSGNGSGIATDTLLRPIQIVSDSGVVIQQGARRAGGAAVQALENTERSCGTYVPDPAYDMMSQVEAEAAFPDMAVLLKKHSNEKREIMLALANAVMICQNATVCWWDGGNILESFLTVLKHSNITNHLIGVMDDETARYLTGRPGVNWFRPNVTIPKVLLNTREANRVSAIKFTLLQQAMQLGYHTLITDMDLVYVQNPFDHLYRDADVEASSDGFDEMAYGKLDSIHDPTMGWGGGGLYMKTFTINVGCAYLRATQRSFTLVKKVFESLSKAAGWDQQVFNEILMTLAHGEHASTFATSRIMHHHTWVNSKTFFRSSRGLFLPGKDSKMPPPVLVHFNYHPDKHKRMVCIMERYFDGKLDACDKFPGGSDAGT